MDDNRDRGFEAVGTFVDDLQASGRYTFTDSELRESMAKSEIAIANALRRLKRRMRLASPRRGFYAIVPTEYRDVGAPPVTWFIDDLMGFLGQPYYVALLSAAAVHGAAHQQPMGFDVMTDRPTREATAGRSRVVFHMSSSLADTQVLSVQTETGYMRVATPESTAFDLVRFAGASGGWRNVATVLAELADHLDPEALSALAGRRKTPEIQRLGYLLDLVVQPRLAVPLLRLLSSRRFRSVPLAPEAPRGEIAAAAPWRVIPNEPVEVDL